MRKHELMEAIRAELRGQLERLNRAAGEAREAATDPGSKAESKYDTRSLEASYLAAGQARHALELAESLRILDAHEPPEFTTGAPIDAGALVAAECAGDAVFYLLVPAAGGMSIIHDDAEVTLLSPASRLYQNLLGLRAGDTLDQAALTVTGIW